MRARLSILAAALATVVALAPTRGMPTPLDDNFRDELGAREMAEQSEQRQQLLLNAARRLGLTDKDGRVRGVFGKVEGGVVTSIVANGSKRKDLYPELDLEEKRKVDESRERSVRAQRSVLAELESSPNLEWHVSWERDPLKCVPVRSWLGDLPPKAGLDDILEKAKDQLDDPDAWLTEFPPNGEKTLMTVWGIPISQINLPKTNRGYILTRAFNHCKQYGTIVRSATSTRR